MGVPALSGIRLTLRPPRPTDRDEWRALGRSPEVARGFGVELPRAREATMEEADSWFADFARQEHAWAIDLGAGSLGRSASTVSSPPTSAPPWQ